MAQDHTKARLRVLEELAETAQREEQLGRDGFLSLPATLQSQLSLLQAQSDPEDESLEAILGAEHSLKVYDAKLVDALNLVSQLGSAQERRQRTRRLRLIIALVASTIVGGGLWGGRAYSRARLAEREASCAQALGCVEDGKCRPSIRWYPPPVVIECGAGNAQHCSDSTGCMEMGRCTLVGTACVVATDDDCKGIGRCHDEGWCSARNGSCVAATRDDCAATKQCRERGACTPIDDICRAGADSDCEYSNICKTMGACREIANTCVKLQGDAADAGAPDAGGKAP